jgi:hypothetical protein
MGFAGAGSADEDGVALGVQESAGGELANLPFVDWRIGEHELVVSGGLILPSYGV